MAANRLLIGGKLILAEGGRVSDVINPATGKAFTTVPDASRGDLEKAIAAAKNAYKTWKKTSFEERAVCLKKFADTLKARQSEFAKALTLEQGKPLAFANGEVGGVIRECYNLASENLLKPEVVSEDKRGRVELHYVPRGVVGGITPWNFPILMACDKLMPAVVTGNTIVLKPSPHTPLTTVMMGELAATAFPPGVINILSGGNELGRWIVDHPDIVHITFTGSAATGKNIMKSAAGTLKKLTLELGGNDAAIVMPETNLDEVAPQIFGSAMFNSGQTCVAIKRVFVHESQYEDFVDKIGNIAKQATVGDGTQDGIAYGPMNNEMQLKRIEMLVDDAKKNGGRILSGGERITVPGKEGGYYYPPTMVADLTDEDRLVKEEQFGMALPILKYKDVDEALERANNSEYGLGGSVWGPDAEKAAEVAVQLESGMSWVNQHLVRRDEVAPFGGVKASGLGSEGGGAIGLKEFVDVKSLYVKKLKSGL